MLVSKGWIFGAQTPYRQHEICADEFQCLFVCSLFYLGPLQDLSIGFQRCWPEIRSTAPTWGVTLRYVVRRRRGMQR